MDCKFVVNQKVVCITDNWAVIDLCGLGTTTDFPQHGKIYTVVAMLVPIPTLPTTLVLKELDQKNAYLHTGFRPLQDRPTEADTDISVFLPCLDVRAAEGVDAL